MTAPGKLSHCLAIFLGTWQRMFTIIIDANFHAGKLLSDLRY